MQQNHMDNPNHPWNKGPDVVMFFMRSIAAVPELCLHHGFGRRHLGLQAAAAILVMPLFTLLMPEHDPKHLLQLDALYIGMCVVARIGGLRDRWKGHYVHSFYSGRPRIMRLLPRVSELAVKKYVEPLIVFATAVATLGWDQLLGAFLLVAAFCLGASVALVDAFEQRRAIDLSDSLFDQESLAFRLRALRRDSF